jgi:hypothetical protein
MLDLVSLEPALFTNDSHHELFWTEDLDEAFLSSFPHSTRLRGTFHLKEARAWCTQQYGHQARVVTVNQDGKIIPKQFSVGTGYLIDLESPWWGMWTHFRFKDPNAALAFKMRWG